MDYLVLIQLDRHDRLSALSNTLPQWLRDLSVRPQNRYNEVNQEYLA